MRHLLLILAIVSSIVVADSAVITWTPPTERVDGTPLPATEIGSYILRVDGTQVAEIPGTETTYTISGLPVGTYSFDMATKDTVGRIGPFSVAVQKRVDAPPGGAGSVDVIIVP